jgi:hypothetical protein
MFPYSLQKPFTVPDRSMTVFAHFGDPGIPKTVRKRSGTVKNGQERWKIGQQCESSKRNERTTVVIFFLVKALKTLIVLFHILAYPRY